MVAVPDRGRRALLFGRRAAKPAIRPPWALAEAAFLDACTACGACVEACPENVLAIAGGGHPVFDPTRGECTFCGACARACASGAIGSSGSAWDLAAAVGDACMPRNGVVCSSCRDACPAQAIHFPILSRLPLPEVDAEACTGCGACVSVCPVGAIALQARTQETA
jgi:ferredoxin-type protein NapF